MRRLLHHLALILPVLAVSGVASAQPGDARARAAALYQEANGLYDAGQIAEAEAKYEQAWRLQPSFEIATNLANTEMQLGRHAEAATHLAHALRVLPASREADRPSIEKLFAEARARVGAIEVVTEEGATVGVDGEAVGLAPLAVAAFVMPGEHEVVVTKSGRRGSAKVAADAGGSHRVEVVLATPSGAEPRPFVGGDDDAQAGMSWIPGAAIGASGLVVMGLGGVFLGMAGGAASDAERIRGEIEADGASCPQGATDPRCTEGRDADDRHGTFQAVGGVAMGLGAAALVTGAVLLTIGVTDDEPTVHGRRTRRTAVVPVVGRDVSGLVVNGAF